jgi:hypothetical protein
MKIVIGTVVLLVLAGCSSAADYGVSALVRGEQARSESTGVKVDLAEIVTP